MTSTISGANVPDHVRVELAARASRSGRTLEEHLRNVLVDLASKDDPVAQMSAVLTVLGACVAPSVTSSNAADGASARG